VRQETPDAMTAADVVRRTGLKGAELKKQLGRMIRRLVDRHQLAAQVFLGEDGALKPAAAKWMRVLARDNFVESTTWAGDRDTMLINEGRRRLALEILSSAKIDAGRLEALTRLEREIE
jgi:hypothetical protein